MATTAVIAVSTFGGTRYYRAQRLEDTPARVRVKVLAPNGVFLLGGRFAEFEQVILLPKHAIRELDADDNRIETDQYTGHIYGYGGSVDARKAFVRPPQPDHMTSPGCGALPDGGWECNCGECGA
ncbi:hypothetical protein [Ottowia sp.]|uniref:hypothetical protein n=1 Tax=Ottowia sp. TaxID=1898956 RepID=UPI0025FC0868|nr:hypothetical protein [Ottowia sp.]MBK6616421.1 hypothetical protein [Ottowia sp.]